LIVMPGIIGKTRKQKPDAGHIHPLFGFRHGATGNYIIYGRRIKARTLVHRGFQHVRQHVIGPHCPEHSARRLAYRGTHGSGNIGILYLSGRH
jgi:hypothetical protein